MPYLPTDNRRRVKYRVTQSPRKKKKLVYKPSRTTSPGYSGPSYPGRQNVNPGDYRPKRQKLRVR